MCHENDFEYYHNALVKISLDFAKGAEYELICCDLDKAAKLCIAMNVNTMKLVHVNHLTHHTLHHTKHLYTQMKL